MSARQQVLSTIREWIQQDDAGAGSGSPGEGGTQQCSSPSLSDQVLVLVGLAALSSAFTACLLLSLCKFQSRRCTTACCAPGAGKARDVHRHTL